MFLHPSCSAKFLDREFRATNLGNRCPRPLLSEHANLKIQNRERRAVVLAGGRDLMTVPASRRADARLAANNCSCNAAPV